MGKTREGKEGLSARREGRREGGRENLLCIMKAVIYMLPGTVWQSGF